VKSEDFKLPDGQEAVKTFGTMKLTNSETDAGFYVNYEMLTMVQDQGVEQVLILYKSDDQYAIKMVDEILESVELKPALP
jgi:hypothetical protein